MTSGLVKQERNNLEAIFNKKEIATVSNYLGDMFRRKGIATVSNLRFINRTNVMLC